MNNKLSIEEFRKYKEQLQKIIEDFKNNYEVMKNNPSYNEAQEEEKLFQIKNIKVCFLDIFLNLVTR